MKIESDLYKGKSFSSIEKAYRADPVVKIVEDLGWFDKKSLSKPIAEKAFSLKKGGVSNIIETKGGFHIIKVLDITHSRHTTLEKARPEIKKILYRKEMGKMIDAWMKNARKRAQIEIML
jgi:parvulin-like peptidyl-prolyl isomerase